MAKVTLHFSDGSRFQQRHLSFFFVSLYFITPGCLWRTGACVTLIQQSAYRPEDLQPQCGVLAAMLKRWQLFLYFHILFSLSLFSFSSLASIPRVPFIKAKTSSSISSGSFLFPSFFLFLSSFLLFLSPFLFSLSFLKLLFCLFVHILGTESNTLPGYKRTSFEILQFCITF